MIQSPSRVIQAALAQRDLKRAKNAATGKRNHAIGGKVQDEFADLLRTLGVRMVETVHTGWTVIRHKETRQIVGAFPIEKVSGDVRGVLAGGTSVLCECKKRGDRLTFSDLEQHQHDALNYHHAAGALSLVGFKWEAQGGGRSLMAWPIPGFVARTSISIERAQQLNIRRIYL